MFATCELSRSEMARLRLRLRVTGCAGIRRMGDVARAAKTLSPARLVFDNTIRVAPECQLALWHEAECGRGSRQTAVNGFLERIERIGRRWSTALPRISIWDCCGCSAMSWGWSVRVRRTLPAAIRPHRSMSASVLRFRGADCQWRRFPRDARSSTTASQKSVA